MVVGAPFIAIPWASAIVKLILVAIGIIMLVKMVQQINLLFRANRTAIEPRETESSWIGAAGVLWSCGRVNHDCDAGCQQGRQEPSAAQQLAGADPPNCANMEACLARQAVLD